jgi:hypothetical protein
MRAWARGGRFVLEEVADEVAGAVAGLGFAPEGDSWVRSFPAAAPYAAAAAGRFVACAEALVRQAAGSEPAPWEETLAMLLARTGGDGWWLAGSAAVAVRGGAVPPKDLDLISDADGCVQLAAVLSDLLIEPLADGGYLGAQWFRGFDGARFECIGGVHASVDDGEAPSDFGPVAASRLETVQWRGHRVRVPPLDLQLDVSERRGLEERARAIRALQSVGKPSMLSAFFSAT